MSPMDDDASHSTRLTTVTPSITVDTRFTRSDVTPCSHVTSSGSGKGTSASPTRLKVTSTSVLGCCPSVLTLLPAGAAGSEDTSTSSKLIDECCSDAGVGRDTSTVSGDGVSIACFELAASERIECSRVL